MTKITSVLFSLWVCLISGPFSNAGDFTASYHQCLKNEREKIQASVKEACGREGDSNPSGEANSENACLERAKSIQISEAVNKRCRDDALKASGREPEPAVAREVPQLQTGFIQADQTQPTAAPAAARVRPSASPAVKPPKATPTDDDPPAEDRPRRDAGETARTASPEITPESTDTGFTRTISAEIEADQDIARCATANSAANDCCNNPLSCSDQLNREDSNSLGALGAMLGGGAQNGGLSDYCRQMGALGSNTGNVNTGLASICFGSHAGCSTTCGNLAQKYSNLLSECDGCAAEEIYRNARRSLEASKNSCTNLRTRSDQLAVTGLGSANNQAVAEYCSQVSGIPSNSPAAATPPRSASPFINHLLAYNCDANPNNPDCKAMDPRAAAKGAAGFKDAEKKNADFNIPDSSQGFKGYAGNRGPETQTNEPGRNNLPKVGTVANNTGGPVGGGSGFDNPATLPPRNKAGAPAGGLNTQVDNGFQGGGGYSQPVAPNHDEPSRINGYAPLPTTDTQFESIDLRQFLPGGSRAAMRRLAGSSEINAKEENLFLRISNKIMEKCRLGLLWQCR